jgi:alanyl-tRNA synthetase/REP element-mobilizing transposase RayT
MTSAEIRQSFLDFFKSKQHTIVPSSSLMPDAPNLLFTNAGMNQFVPIFLGQRKADVSKWSDAVLGLDTRAADTQKVIRAGGKHNDLEDVGLDTYHHTFFEMLGNWSFGDYFKKEAIEWAWELVVGIWKFPPERLYATVYSPDKSKSDPSEFDQEAYDHWAQLFRAAGLDPAIHIVNGNKKDNFWMMGDTGPCGPCSEIHVDLTPAGDTRGALVNQGDARCIEIWNLVFIQFNANPDGTFSPLPAKHVDTGMGFERVTSIIQGTKGFKDFASAKISNYETDVFRPIFDELEKLSGKRYRSTLPDGRHALSRVLGEHTRPRVSPSAPPPMALASSGPVEAKYSRRNLPHFERPWAKYMVTFSTRDHRSLSPRERDLTLKSVLYAHEHRQIQLYAACVMPDHVHLLFEPQIKEQDKEGKPVFWLLSEILQGIKSASAHNINQASGQKGAVWENESMDRMIRGDSDMEEKFHYICRNPWDSGVVPTTENYPWLWTPEVGAWQETQASRESERPLPTAGAQSAAREGACGPQGAASPLPQTEQEQIDIAFRVIADHIRTLSFAIADGIQPGNNDRNYVLRRILRRAVRYGRTLGFHEPFFCKLVDVLADTMGQVFPDIREKRKHVQEVIRVEEEAFNKTLDRGIALFEQEVALLLGGTGYQPVAAGNLPAAPGATYSKRNLPHFEKPWAIYVVDFRTSEGRLLSSPARDIVFDCIHHWRNSRYRLVAACVMPDHVHFIIQPGVKEEDQEGNPIFWSLSSILHSIKSFSANEINKAEKGSGPVWQEERFDQYIRSDRDLEEKFHYVCRNPWAAGLVDQTQSWPWLWSEDIEASKPYVQPTGLPYAKAAGQVARQNGLVARSTQLSGAFAFKLYDEQGFPLDLTQLMAREHGLTVDVEGFNRLMEEQKARARAAQKKQVIEISQIETATPTRFVGYDKLETPAKVLEVVSVKDKSAVILDTSVCYAEMGGQVGDTGELSGSGQLWRVVNTQKTGNAWLHFIVEGEHTRPRVLQSAPSPIASADVEEAVGEAATAARGSACGPQPESSTFPIPGSTVTLGVEVSRRFAIQRHHTVTHLFHWALREVVSKDATQKGSYVGPEKLTFDFNSAPLTPQQIADIEKLVNERIVENGCVSWIEVPYSAVKSRKDILQFFGDRYGEVVRVVQIGGQAGVMNGYSMELCGGTHTRATGEIGLFRIVAESAIAAGVRRVEAVAGLTAYDVMKLERELIKSVAGKVNSPVHELEKRIENLLEQQKTLEKQLKAMQQKEAANAAKNLIAKAAAINGVPAIIQNMGALDGDTLQGMVNELKGQFKGVIVLGGAANNAVALIAAVTPEFTARFQAGKIIQQIAPIVGGKGGGKPDNARGGGKDASKLDEALAKARSLLG